MEINGNPVGNENKTAGLSNQERAAVREVAENLGIRTPLCFFKGGIYYVYQNEGTCTPVFSKKDAVILLNR